VRDEEDGHADALVDPEELVLQALAHDQAQVAGQRRTIVLPRALVDAPTIGAKMEDGVLRIRFEGRADTRSGKSKKSKRGD